eukprot:1139043-Pelagomonas_calceolata.AAC.3
MLVLSCLHGAVLYRCAQQNHHHGPSHPGCNLVAGWIGVAAFMDGTGDVNGCLVHVLRDAESCAA